MTTAHPARGGVRPASALDHLQTAFTLLVTGPRPLAVDTRPLEGLPDRRVPLDELGGILLARSTPLQTRDLIWRHLLARVRTGRPEWVVGAAGLALPGLRNLAGRIAVDFRGDTADLDSEILTGFLHALRTADPDRPALARRLLWSAYRAGLKARHSAEGLLPCLLPLGSQAPPRPYGHPDLVLTDAVARGVLTLLEARIIGCTRLENMSLAEAADRLAMSYEAVRKVRQRAEPRLARAILRGD
jgi:hypothetical protein